MLICIYRCLLRLYPPTFRQAFRHEMEADVADMLSDAAQKGGGWIVTKACFETAIDLATSLFEQWIISGWPAVVVIALAWTASAFELLAYQFVPFERRFNPFVHSGAGPTMVLGIIGVLTMGAMFISQFRWHARLYSGLPRTNYARHLDDRQ
jgi:hypothetical protein